jgi:periplasmic copper chaperone A
MRACAVSFLAILSAAFVAACQPAAPKADPPAAPGAASMPAATAGTAAASIGAISILAPRMTEARGSEGVAGGYLTIRNTGAEADRLIGVSAAGLKSAELHSMSNDGGMMKMEKVVAIDVPAGGEVKLEPGGLHLMLFGAGGAADPLTVTLTFEKAGKVDVALARMAADTGKADDHAGHDMSKDHGKH